MAKVVDKEINEELSESYLKYAGYVLQTRAIPDARDCLKDGARKILWSMLINKHTADRGRVKSVGAVGEVMKYSVHGNASILGTMMRLSQPYSLRYPLIDGQGNTGSIIAGDDYSADRYTEVRTSKVASDIMRNLDKDIVSFKQNYDETLLMPTVMPSYFPNFVNGATGIGVGAACSCPQFNINEVVDALVKFIERKGKVEFDDIYCPIDFATGAIIVNEEEVKESLKNGCGTSAKVRAKIEYNEEKRQLIVRELPYQVFTDTVCKQLADGINEGNITQVESFFDGTSFTGVNIKIQLTKKASVKKALEELYKFTSLEIHFSINMVMLKDGVSPKIFGWKELLETYINHLKLMISRSHKYDYEKLLDKIHIYEGYLIALTDIDNIIKLIKASDNNTKACLALIEKYNLSEVQAKAILDMKLQRLTKLNSIEIKTKLDNYKKEADYHKNIFSIEENLDNEAIKELLEIKKKYGDKRRTVNKTISPKEENAIEEKQILLYISNEGAIRSRETESLSIQKRGLVGTKIKFNNKKETIWKTVIGKTTDKIVMFSNLGKCYTINMFDLYRNEEFYLNEIVELEPNEKISNILSYEELQNSKYVIFATKNGLLKKTNSQEFLSTKRKTGLISIKLKENDTLAAVDFIKNEEDRILLVTEKGNYIFIEQTEISSTGRNTMGVKGINLNNDDLLKTIQIINNDINQVLVATTKGFGKRVKIEEFNLTSRNTKGSRIITFKDEDDTIADILAICNTDEEVIINSNLSSLKTRIDSISTLSRNAMGVQLLNTNNNLKIKYLNLVN